MYVWNSMNYLISKNVKKINLTRFLKILEKNTIKYPKYLWNVMCLSNILTILGPQHLIKIIKYKFKKIF